jgi:hypothetical protein
MNVPGGLLTGAVGVPSPGQLVAVRQRRYVVTGVVPSAVDASCKELGFHSNNPSHDAN